MAGVVSLLMCIRACLNTCKAPPARERYRASRPPPQLFAEGSCVGDFSRFSQRLLRHMGLAMSAVVVVVATSTHCKRRICEGLAVQAISHAILHHARHVCLLAASCRSCAVWVLPARQDGALHVAQVQKELLVLQAGPWLVGAALFSLLSTRDVKAAAPAQVVPAAARHRKGVRARGLLAACPRRLPEVVLPTRQARALGIAEACVQLLVIRARVAIVEVLLGRHRLRVGLRERRRCGCCRLVHSRLAYIRETDRG